MTQGLTLATDADVRPFLGLQAGGFRLQEAAKLRIARRDLILELIRPSGSNRLGLITVFRSHSRVVLIKPTDAHIA